jgi:hypothetical protein
LPEPKEGISPGFLVVPPEGRASLEERYAAIRKEIESARKDLRNGGWARLYTALLKLKKLRDEEPALRQWDNICKVVLGKPRQEVFDLLERHRTAENLAEAGFSEDELRGPEEEIDRKLAHADPKAFNFPRTKKAIVSYRHFKMWNRKASI